MFRSLLHFSPTVKKAIAMISFVALALLCYKHICNDRQQQAEIEFLKAKIAELETTDRMGRRAQSTTMAATVSQEKITKPQPAETKREGKNKRRNEAVSPSTADRPKDQISIQNTVPDQNTTEPLATTVPTAVSTTTEQLSEEQTSTTTLSYSRKFDSPRLIDLNTADSATLVRIPGIGAATSGAILRYRARLGGFYSSAQLPECIRWADAERIASWQQEWLVADTTRIIPMVVNRLEFKELLRHPYLEYRQVCALMDLKRKRGSIKSLEEIGRLPEFDKHDIERLRPYLDFSTK